MKNKTNYIKVISTFVFLNSCTAEGIQNEGGEAVGSILGLIIIVGIIFRVVKHLSKPNK